MAWPEQHNVYRKQTMTKQSSRIVRAANGTYAPGHSGNLRHGGDAAVTAIRKGTELAGVGAEAELAAWRALGDDGTGRVGLVIRGAVRLEAAASIYWDALKRAAEAQDIAKLDQFMARFGWLQGAALRAWAQVKAEGGAEARVIDYEVLLERQGGDGG